LVRFLRVHTHIVAFTFSNSGLGGVREALRTNVPSPPAFNDGNAPHIPVAPRSESETLASAIARLGARAIEPTELPQLIETVLLACDAIAHAHGRGVFHGALNPSSIAHDGSGVVSVRGGSQDLERSSPAYFSTEQAWGRRADFDARTDVYAFGAILFAILTGRAPHEQPTVELQLASARSGVQRAPQALCPERALPPELCRISSRALSASRNDRYPSIAMLKRDLELFMRTLPALDPIAAKPAIRMIALAS
jgi:serine/threonine protein kinase